MKKAFTLIEIMIVVVLFGLLWGIILKSYSTITMLAMRIEQDQALVKELLLLSQVLENIAEEATIDYAAYQEHHIDLKSTKGLTDVLYLTGGQRTGVEIRTRGSCQIFPWADIKKIDKPDPNCDILFQKGQISFPLVENKQLNSSKVTFKIIPFQSSIELVEENELNLKSGKPAFRLLSTRYSKNYDPEQRVNKSIVPIQLFFTCQGKTSSIYDLNA